MAAPWHISVDTGGTFTDVIARDPGGQRHRAKVLSSGWIRLRASVAPGDDLRVWQLDGAPAFDPERWRVHLRRGGAMLGRGSVQWYDASKRTLTIEWDQLPDPGHADDDDSVALEFGTGESAPIVAARIVTGTPAGQALPPMRMRLATTRGTNALLERAGADVAFFITRGFGDLLRIGDQRRPDLFALHIRKREPLHGHVVEVDERLAADGSVLRELDEDALRAAAARLVEQGCCVAAVACLHSYRNDAHERRIAELLREAGFTHVSCSAALAPLIEILPRAETCVVDAYLAPIIEAYLAEVRSTMPCEASRLHVMTSAGGLVEAGRYHAKDSLLSGPAGGVAGAAAAARRAGFRRIIGFDMGGTSTDVARVDGDFEYRFSHTVAGAQIVAPALAIETVAAGGGSICTFENQRLLVGPRSAGADPGPACYGAGGPLTLTDVNLLAGRIDPAQFEVPIDRTAADRALVAVIERIIAAGQEPPERDALLDGFLTIANERMAATIEQVSLRRGYAPADHALVSFGGAGGQHACAIAAQLGIGTVLMPPDASLLSAVGLEAAAVERVCERQVLQPLEEIGEALDDWFTQCAEEAIERVAEEGIERSAIIVRRRIAHARLLGQDSTIDMEFSDGRRLAEQFRARYRELYGTPPPDEPIEVESIRVIASSRGADVETAGDESPPESVAATASRTMRGRFDGAWREVDVFDRGGLEPGATLCGPAMIFDQRSAYVIETGWTTRIDGHGAIIATREAPERSGANVARREEPELVRLELFTNQLSAIAEEMGEMLQRTALSTNVKRRLDFSCGVLDADGELLVNAPHIPVHLGALGLCVRAVAEAIDLKPGDVAVTNHPGLGGSHLPDITVITPVHDEDGARIGYVASRAHHAEVGGTRPGSMPADARSLAEEGVLIPPMRLMHGGEPRFEQVAEVLRGGAYPSRSVRENVADLRAAVAANHRGAERLRELFRAFGGDSARSLIAALQDRAASLARSAVSALSGERLVAEERLDDESVIRVAIERTGGGDGERVIIDFGGSSPVHPGNLNATPAIVRSAVLYVLRSLIGERLPLNEAIMRMVDIRLPCCLLNPEFDEDPAVAPAVVGGNTETSQRLVDTLLKALGACACSQGTMNNIVFGNDRYSYYETICGGSGAGPQFDGADAVHTHMTNTRITDPETLEHRYPVRLERFAIRAGSGGEGAHHGGNGVVRELRFLQPTALSVLTQHRTERPYGLDGGESGACGSQRIVRADGSIVRLESVDQCELKPNDRLIIDTPGGGGFGRKGERE